MKKLLAFATVCTCIFAAVYITSCNNNSESPKETDKVKLRHFKEPKPAREVSLIFPKSELKIQIIDALRNTIAGVIKGAIVFQNVQIISPLSKK